MSYLDKRANPNIHAGNMNRDLIEKKLAMVHQRLEEIEALMADPSVASDPNRLGELGREHGLLKRIINVEKTLVKLESMFQEASSLLDDSDEEIRDLAQIEIKELEPRIERVLAELRIVLLPSNPSDDRDAIVEIRAGTGGDEAALFAGDLLRMYQRLIERKGWKCENISSHPSEIGGFKEVVFAIRGDSVFGQLKFEGGVHRVQRVPETESQGRIHTSAATVAVLPEAEEVDVEIRPEDLRIDTYRSSGAGGQHVNKTDSAVRITHLPTNLVVSCQDEKSQHKNKAKAMLVLRSRLYKLALEEERSKRSESRRIIVGSGDRSAKIRTYNYPQNRVTDHRISLTLYRLEEILDGDLDELLEALRLSEAESRLQEEVG